VRYFDWPVSESRQQQTALYGLGRASEDLLADCSKSPETIQLGQGINVRFRALYGLKSDIVPLRLLTDSVEKGPDVFG
jgi:hypothetical protein